MASTRVVRAHSRLRKGSVRAEAQLRLNYSDWDAGTAAAMAGQLDDRQRQCWDAGTAALGNPGLEGGGSDMQDTTALECWARKGGG